MVRVHGGGSEESERSSNNWEDRKYYSLKACGDDVAIVKNGTIRSPNQKKYRNDVGMCCSKINRLRR